MAALCLLHPSIVIAGFLADALHLHLAYGEAAEVVLEVALKPLNKLCALVAYYPNKLPPPGAGFPPSLNVVVHLAGQNPPYPKFHSYTYPHAANGFAEEDLDQYDRVSASLAWTRTLATVRKGFEIEVDLEKIWEDHVTCESLQFVVPYGC